MKRVSHADDPEARRLREMIAAELIALRETFSVRGRTADTPVGAVVDQLGDILRGNPAWAAGAAAGALAGIVAAIRRRRHDGR